MKPKDSLSLNSEKQEMPLAVWLNSAKSRLQNRPDEPTSSIHALVGYVLGKSTHFGISHPEYNLTEIEVTSLDELLDQLADGIPLPYLTGKQEFFGLEFLVSPDVLIPRPETEILVMLAGDWLRNRQRHTRVLDVGTGSGCIAVSICSIAPDATVFAVDKSFKALQVAANNVEKHGLEEKIFLIQSDLIIGISSKFDCICANLPYIPTDRLPQLNVSKHEPSLALDGGDEGLRMIERLLKLSKEKIAENGIFFIEIDYTQEKMIAHMAEENFPGPSVKIEKDLAGLARVAIIDLAK